MPRGSSGGSHRSSGGHRSSSRHSSSRSRSSSHRSSSFSSSSRSSNRTYSSPSMNSHNHTVHSAPPIRKYYRRRPFIRRSRYIYEPGMGYYYNGSNFGLSCFKIILSMVFIYLFCFIFVIVPTCIGTYNNYYNESNNYNSNIVSNIVRTKQDPTLCNITPYVYDNLGYMSNRYSNDEIPDGMEYFFEETGIQPVLLTMDINEYSKYDESSEGLTNLDNLYDSMFNDESHLLFIIFGNKEDTVDWKVLYVQGGNSENIMDSEAEEIFWNHYDNLPYSSFDKFINDLFEKTADDIM